MNQNNPAWKDLENYIFPHEAFLCHVFNACLYQHPEENVRNLMEYNHVRFQFHLDHFYFCLTGIKKGLYHNYYGIHPSVYVEIFCALKKEITALCAHHLWCCDVFLVWREDEKQIAILMSPESDSQFTAEELALEIDKLVQQKYDDSIFKGDTQYRNVTSLSMPLHGFHAIRTGYQQVRALGNLSFFRMDGCILSDKTVDLFRTNTDYPTILDACFTLRSYIDEGNFRQAKQQIAHLFLNTIRNSYSLTLCDDALSFIKSTLQVRCTVYGVEPEKPLDVLCSRDSYHKVEECVEALSLLLGILCAAVNSQGSYSKPVLSAIYYIKMHFSGYLVLADIARYTNTNASYLSSKFKEETGYSVRNYINKIRMETAQQLLTTGKDTLSVISQQIGFNDVRYFTRLFKEFTGCTPTEYRRSKQNHLKA